MPCSATAASATKPATPTIIHVLSVMHRVREAGGDEIVQIIAVLHDTVEDTCLTLLEIEEQFGTFIAAAVDALTRRPDEPYEQYILRVAGNPEAVVVKIQDLRDNLDPKRHSWVNDAATAEQWARRERRYLDALQVLESP